MIIFIKLEVIIIIGTIIFILKASTHNQTIGPDSLSFVLCYHIYIILPVHSQFLLDPLQVVYLYSGAISHSKTKTLPVTTYFFTIKIMTKHYIIW